jgi:hypothetical protein
MIKTNFYKLSSSGTFEINNVDVTNSTITLFRLTSLTNATVAGRQLKMSNITYRDSEIQYQHDLLYFGGIETTSDFTIYLDQIKMTNITFDRTGHLIIFGQQTAQSLQLTNSVFTNLYSSDIYFGSSNLQNSVLKTKVNMQNITAQNIDGGVQSFFSINEGTELTISDSKFSRITNLESGSVLNAGYQNSITSVYNSEFKENASINGGVANVQDGSVIKFYNCTFNKNFAIQSGVIQATNDGSFEFYNSTMTANYAYSLPISQIFIVTTTPKFDGCIISENIALELNLHPEPNDFMLWFMHIF